MPELPTQEQVQAQFDAATEAEVSPCSWIPPEWPEVTINNAGKRVLPDNSADAGSFNDAPRRADWEQYIGRCESKQVPEGPESQPNDGHWPNPFSDFSHVDDEEFSARSIDLVRATIDPGSDGQAVASACKTVASFFEANRGQILAALKAKRQRQLFQNAMQVLQGEAFVKPGDLKDLTDILDKPGPIKTGLLSVLGKNLSTFEAVLSALQGCGHGYDLLNRRDTVAKLHHVAGPGSPGMKRLALVFEWVLWRTTELMNDLNAALDSGESAYNDARTNYINFIRDIDDHEPEKKHDPWDVTDKTARSCYGRALKWNCIDPVIYQGRIVGARAVVKWNPHSSSSGYPLYP